MGEPRYQDDVTVPFTTRYFRRAAAKIPTALARRAKPGRKSRAVFARLAKLKNQYVVTLSNMPRHRARPSSLTLPLVDRVFRRAVPSGRPRASGARLQARTPRSGSLASAFAEEQFVVATRWKTKTLQSVGSGGSAVSRCRTCLCESAPMSRACVIGWLKAIRQSHQNLFAGAKHCSTHVFHEHHVREGAVSTLIDFHRQALRVRIIRDADGI